MDIKVREERGITLVALVITIIILLILAGISVNIILGQNGLIKRSEETKKLHEISAITEQLEIEKGSMQINDVGNITVEKYLEHIIKEGIINKEDILETENENENAKYIIVEEKYVFLIEKENDNIKITYEGELKDFNLKLHIQITNVTTNSITVKIKGLNNCEYDYYIKDVETGKGYELKKTQQENEYIFEGLMQNRTYQIKVVAKNSYEEASKESSVIRTIELESLKEEYITFIYDPDNWTNKTVTVSANVSQNIQEGGTIQTSKDANIWTDEISQTFTENGIMYVRIYDGVNETNYVLAEVSKIDLKEPEDAKIVLGKKEIDIGESTIATVTQNDNESGVNIEKCRWVYNTNSSKIGIDTSKYTGGTFTSIEQEITLTATKSGEYYLHILTIDNAGNAKETVSSSPIIVREIPRDGLLFEVSKINKSGVQTVTTNGQTYSLDVIYYDGNLTVSPSNTFTDTSGNRWNPSSLGRETDCATASRDATNMVVLKVNGDLTIKTGCLLRPVASSNGYGGPKGFLVYCSGTLTNNGTISMTARGARANGENIYLLKNTNGSYEYVPAQGAVGGVGIEIKQNSASWNSSNGNNGKDATGRASGGGRKWSCISFLYMGK